MLKFSKFGGMAPKLHTTQLPEGAAIVAHNVETTSGALRPVLLPTIQYVSAGEILTAESPIIAKPSAPTVSDRYHMCRPFGNNPSPTNDDYWLRVDCAVFIAYVASNGVKVDEVHAACTLSAQDIDYDETGFTLKMTQPAMPSINLAYPPAGPFSVRGPRYQFLLGTTYNGSNPSRNLGGPPLQDAGIICVPDVVYAASPIITGKPVPLATPENLIYAQFQAVDAYCPLYDEDYVLDPDDIPSASIALPATDVAFRVELNYAKSSRTTYYFVSSNIDSEDREGPPSEQSSRIVQLPGEVLELSIPHAEDKVRLYRSTTGGDDFRVIYEGTGTTYEDFHDPYKADVLPQFGNRSSSWDTVTIDGESYLKYSRVHPASFGVCFKDDVLWLSDIERLHVWPEENSYTFPDDIVSIALCGDSVVVFSGTRVYAVSGSNPKRMTVSLISETTPLLNEDGLCQIGNVIYWPTTDGLAATTGGDVQLVTSEHVTRRQWLSFSPSTMKCGVADRSIFCELNAVSEDDQTDDGYTGSIIWPNGEEGEEESQYSGVLAVPFNYGCDEVTGIRFDLDEQLAAMTLYNSSGKALWRSGKITFSTKKVIDYVRVVGADATLYAYFNGADHELALSANDLTATGWNESSRAYIYTLITTGTVTGFEVYERQVNQIVDDITVTPENCSCFRDIFVNFAHPEAFAGGVLLMESMQTQESNSVDILMYQGEGTEPYHTATVENGGWFGIPRDKRTTNHLHHVDVNTQQNPASLYLSRVKPVPFNDAITEINDGAFAPWLVKKYTSDTPKLMRSVRVVSKESDVFLRVYLDGAVTPDEVIEIQAGIAEYVIPDDHICHSVEIEFWDEDGENRKDKLISRVDVFSQNTVLVNEAFSVSNSQAVRCNEAVFPDVGHFEVVQVVADTYPVYLWLDAVGIAIPSSEPLSLRKSGLLTRAKLATLLTDAAKWRIDITSGSKAGSVLTSNILAINLYPQVSVGTEGSVISASNSGMAGWLRSVYTLPIAKRPRSVRVNAKDDVTMRFWFDDATTAETLSLVPHVETIFETAHSPVSNVHFDFNGDDDQVYEAYLFFEEHVEIPSSGLVLRDTSGQIALRNKTLRFATPGTFSVGRVVNGFYPVTVTLNGVSNTFDSNQAKVLTRPSIARDHEMDIVRTGEVENEAYYSEIPGAWASNDIAFITDTCKFWKLINGVWTNISSATVGISGNTIAVVHEITELPEAYTETIYYVVVSGKFVHHTGQTYGTIWEDETAEFNYVFPYECYLRGKTISDMNNSGGDTPIFELQLISAQTYTVEKGIVVIKGESDPMAWLDKRVISSVRQCFTAARVVATGDVVLNVMDQDRNFLYGVPISGNTYFAKRLPRCSPHREYSIDVVCSPSVQIKEVIFSTSMELMKHVG